jgi:uncharacterized membrane protein
MKHAPNEIVGDSAPTMVEQNVEAIMALHDAELRAMTRHQRAIERMVAVITYPAFLFGIAISIAIWIGWNLALQFSGRQPLDRIPFGWLQTGVGVLGLLTTLIIVITQRRLGKVAERNAHLNLQVNLIVEQKVAKIIQLMEEMRADSPTLKDRLDATAEEMQLTVNPSHIATAIADRMGSPETPLDDLVLVSDEQSE